MKRSLCGGALALTLALALAPPVQAQTIYRTTDAQGNVVFTDDPARGGTPMELAPLSVVPAPRPPPAAAPPSAPPASGVAAPFLPYDRFVIAAPASETTLPTGAAGNVAVELAIAPPLRDDHRVRLLVDGAVSQSALHTEAFLLNNLDRGAHRLQAELLDATGRVRHRTPPVTLYVQRASIHLPGNPNNPARSGD